MQGHCPRKAYDQNSLNRAEDSLNADQPASLDKPGHSQQWISSLEVEGNLSVYRGWLLSVAQRSVPPVAAFLGCFLLRAVGSRGTRAGSWGSESLAEQA